MAMQQQNNPPPPPAHLQQSQQKQNNVRSWIQQQEMAFRGWINAHLSAGQYDAIPQDGLPAAISRVVPLINLLEILENGPLPNVKQYHKKPTMRVHLNEGLSICLKQIEKHDKSKGHGTSFDVEKLLSGNTLKLSLALAWRMICAYSIQENDIVFGKPKQQLNTPEENMLWWCNQRLPQKMKVSNFTNDFQSGYVLVNLINHALDPASQLKQSDIADLDPADLLEGVFHVASQELAIPQILDVDAVLQNPDKQSIMTYVALIRTAVTSKEKERLKKLQMEQKLDESEKFHQSEMAKLKESNRALNEKLNQSESLKEMTEQQLQLEQSSHKDTRIKLQNEIQTLKQSLNNVQSKLEEEQKKQDSDQAQSLAENTTLKSENTRLKDENQQLNQRIKELLALQSENSNNNPKIDELIKQNEETKKYYEGKVRQVEQDWEKNRQEFLKYANDLQERLATSNNLGREFRAKATKLEKEKTSYDNQISDLNNELSEKTSEIMQLHMKVEQLSNAMSSQEAVFKIQLQELGTFIKQLKAKEKQNENMQKQAMMVQYGVDQNQQQGGGNGGNGGGAYNDAAPLAFGQHQNIPVAQQLYGDLGNDNGGGNSLYQQQEMYDQKLNNDQKRVSNVNKSHERLHSQDSLEDQSNNNGGNNNNNSNNNGVQMKLNAFDRRIQSVRSKLGTERVHVTWAYIGSDQSQHHILLKHDIKALGNSKESKRIIFVDGIKKYNQKSSVMNWFILVGPDNAQDKVKVQIVETNVAKQYEYKLVINDTSFEELLKNWESANVQSY